MPIERLLAFALVALALIAVPGPSVLFVIGRALTVGRRAALVTVIGNSAGIEVQAAAVALGIGVVVERSELIFSAIKLLGVVYLAWLGVTAIRHRRVLADPLGRPVPLAGSRRAMRDGFVVGLTNPKVSVFFAAILPQFLVPGQVAAPVQMLLLGLVFVVIALVSDSAWALLAGTARGWFAASPRRLERITIGGGLVMLGLAAGLALSDRNG